ncbi:hypothetical protein NKG05_13355 [Oerskovia sp. M15]
MRLVGDASGYVDALTGEGLRVGLAQASAAVGHLDDPAAYERDWTRVTRDYRMLTAGLVTWATSPRDGRSCLSPPTPRALRDGRGAAGALNCGRRPPAATTNGIALPDDGRQGLRSAPVSRTSVLRTTLATQVPLPAMAGQEQPATPVSHP